MTFPVNANIGWWTQYQAQANLYMEAANWQPAESRMAVTLVIIDVWNH
jgi:hypothetical protein